MHWLASLYGIFGLAVGSFLNVCIYRIPRDESVAFPRSHCPHCSKSIRPYDNIPLISYLILAGKCRFCQQPISFQYPAVELLTGLAFFACAMAWRFTSPTYVNSLLTAIILTLMFIDYQHQVLPNRITLPGTAAGILLSSLQLQSYYLDEMTYRIAGILLPSKPEVMLPWVGALTGALLGGGLLWLVGSLYQLLRKRQGLGMGDIKMMAMVGAFLGWRLALMTIFLGSALGSIVGIFLILFRGRTLQTKLAFGTFLGAATLLALFRGLDLLSWYAAQTGTTR